MNEAVEVSCTWQKVVYADYELDKEARRRLGLPRATWMSPAELMAAIIEDKNYKNAPTLAELDKSETAAWYGRGEVPALTTFDVFGQNEPNPNANRKPAIHGLLEVQTEGRYKGLGFNDSEAA